MNPKDHKPITEAEFAEAMKKVFLKPVSTRAKYENKKPTRKELNTRFKLVKKKWFYVFRYIIPFSVA